MLKKIVISIIALVALLIVTGCDNNNQKSTKEFDSKRLKDSSPKLDKKVLNFDKSKAESICENEIKKETVDINTIKQACLITAKKYEDKKDYDNSSWYYILSLNDSYIIDKLDKKIQNREALTTYYTNLGHAYLLNNKLDKAKEAYDLFIRSFGYFDLKEDFKILHKIYPNKKSIINKGNKIWNDVKDRYSDIIIFYNQAEKAKKYSEKVNLLLNNIELYKKHGFKDTALATLYNNIGLLYHDMKDYVNAFKYYEKALSIDEKALGKDDPNLATDYNNIGSLYHDMKDYVNALKYYEKALSINEKALGKDDPNLATDYNNIGLLYQDLKSYKQSKIYLKKALKILQKVFGDNHPNVKDIKKSLRDLRYY